MSRLSRNRGVGFCSNPCTSRILPMSGFDSPDIGGPGMAERAERRPSGAWWMRFRSSLCRRTWLPGPEPSAIRHPWSGFWLSGITPIPTPCSSNENSRSSVAIARAGRRRDARTTRRRSEPRSSSRCGSGVGPRRRQPRGLWYIPIPSGTGRKHSSKARY